MTRFVANRKLLGNLKEPFLVVKVCILRAISEQLLVLLLVVVEGALFPLAEEVEEDRFNLGLALLDVPWRPNSRMSPSSSLRLVRRLGSLVEEADEGDEFALDMLSLRAATGGEIALGVGC